MSPAAIDLRSDTITRPTVAMRRAMAEAEVGDDVYGEDPTVARLQRRGARLLGTEASLFFPSGTMANQVALALHARPGDEVLIEATGHSNDYELGGGAALSGLHLRGIPGDGGVLRRDHIAPHLLPRPYYRSRVRVLVLENTHNVAGGRVYPPDVCRDVCELARAHGLRVHLDGARLFNAAVAGGTPAADLAAGFDSVMVSLSKGLSAPVGSLLGGPAEWIEEARRARKRFGGGMRQAGVIAAAGLVALEEGIDRLAEDHANARRLADGLLETGRVSLACGHVDTNIVMIDVADMGRTAAELCSAAADVGVRCLPFGPTIVRFVTHRHVGADEIEDAIDRLVPLIVDAR